MNNERFNEILEEQINRCWSILSEKEKEYAVSGDRLHNFKVASDLGQTTMKNALAGMMIKHTVSVYDMCFDDHKFSKEIWEEKITDHINYLLILRVLIEQEDLTNERRDHSGRIS